MKKGEQTKEYIVKKAAKLFNERGYFGSSISDIMEVTGLKKGGIYNHFNNKDEIALAAFEYAVEQMSRAYKNAIRGKSSVVEQLIAVFSIYENIIENPPIRGGCPILNTAIESDDTHETLKIEAGKALKRFITFVELLLRKAIKRKEMIPSINVSEKAIEWIALIEGGVMMSKLYEDERFVRLIIERIKNEIERLRV